MNPTSKKLISLFLVFSLVTINCATLKRLEEKREKRKKHGAVLIIQKKDGHQIRGELIVIKQNSLLLLDKELGVDVYVNIVDIKVIRIVKKSKSWKGARWGSIAGLGVGALVKGPDIVWVPAVIILTFGLVDVGKPVGDILGFLLFGFLSGGIIGSLAGIDKTIQIEGMTDLEIREALDKLRKKARIRDYR